MGKDTQKPQETYLEKEERKKKMRKEITELLWIIFLSIISSFITVIVRTS